MRQPPAGHRFLERAGEDKTLAELNSYMDMLFDLVNLGQIAERAVTDDPGKNDPEHRD